MDTLVLFRRGNNKLPIGGDTETMCGMETEELSHLEIIQSSNSEFCACQKVLVD